MIIEFGINLSEGKVKLIMNVFCLNYNEGENEFEKKNDYDNLREKMLKWDLRRIVIIERRMSKIWIVKVYN